MTDYKQGLVDLTKNNKGALDAIGQAGVHFRSFYQETVKPSALDLKTKELLAVAIGIAVRCEGCIMSHVSAAIKAGATFEELSDTVNIAIMMGGGPSVVYGGKAIEAAKQYLDMV